MTEIATVLTKVEAGGREIRGVSLGGVYTSIRVPSLGVLLDVGIPIRSFASSEHIFISHGHADHIGALPALLGIRGLLQQKAPPKVYMPAKIVDGVQRALESMSALQRYDLEITPFGMESGDEVKLRSDLWARAFRTHHPVPSLGYLFLNKVTKLKDEYRSLPGSEIGRLKKSGAEIFRHEERLELAYATDTLVRVLETAPEIKKAKTLILECTFLDDKKSREAARAGCHIHLDELLEVHEELECENLVLMHFSQLYSPKEVHRILANKCPPLLRDKLIVFAPRNGDWPG